MFKYIKAILFIVICILIEYFIGFDRMFDSFKDFAQSNANSYSFLLIMGVGCAIGFPLSFCYVFAAAAFPFCEAFALCIGGLFISSTIGFILGKSFAEIPYIVNLRNRFLPKEKEINRLFKLNFFIRAIPGVAYVAQNLILSSIGSKFHMYIFINMLVQGFISLAMLFLFSGILNENMQKIAVFVLLMGTSKN